MVLVSLWLFFESHYFVLSLLDGLVFTTFFVEFVFKLYSNASMQKAGNMKLAFDTTKYQFFSLCQQFLLYVLC